MMTQLAYEKQTEDLDRQKDIDAWLPVTSSREAKWWYSTFHSVTAMVGAGVLSLPYAMAQLGWGAGVCTLILSWTTSLYTLWQMVEMHEMVKGKRFNRYHELGQHVFGEKLGLYIVVPLQLLTEVSVSIVYMVTGAKSLQKLHKTMAPDAPDIHLTLFIIIFALVHLVLSHLPSFNSISGISLAAAVMSLSYSTIAWTASLHKGVQPNVDYSHTASNTSGAMFNYLTGMGAIVFSFGGQNVALEIQATIPSTPERPSKGPMWKGSVLAYVIIALCYFPVAVIGFYTFGNKVDDNILISLGNPAWLIAAANVFVIIHLIGGYQIFAMPVFDMLEMFFVMWLKFDPSFPLRFVTRTVYVGFTAFISMTFPFFCGLLGFFGGLFFTPTTLFLPCIMWLKLQKPKKFSLSWCCNWICIVLGVLLMVLTPIGGLRSIILDAKTYKLYP